jgi:hypothetical protein
MRPAIHVLIEAAKDADARDDAGTTQRIQFELRVPR